MLAEAGAWWLLLLMARPSPLEAYKVPNVAVELLERGFRVSIPDEAGVKSVAFNVNRNRNFSSFAPGEYSIQVRGPEQGRWSHDFVKNVQLWARDTLYIWTSVQHERAIFRHISEPQQVCELASAQLLTGCQISEQQPSTATEGPRPVTEAETTPCLESKSKVLPPQASPICKGQLLFEELFEQLNGSIWQHEVRLPLDTQDAEFVLYDGQAQVADGNLIIKPTLWPESDISRVHLDLAERCTGTHNRQKECALYNRFGAIMPPVVVPRLNTKESFNFQFGRIELRAKLPKGDWLVPLLLLEPLLERYGQTGYDSGQLRVAMARGNTALRLPSGKIIDGRTLYGGPVLSIEAQNREDFMVNQRRSEHFGNDFHVYGMDWSSDRLRFMVDGLVYGELLSGFSTPKLNPLWSKGGPLAPFDQLFYITLGISVGGFGDFVNHYEKPWANKDPQARLRFWEDRRKWLPTWQQSSELLIDYVRVFAN